MTIRIHSNFTRDMRVQPLPAPPGEPCVYCGAVGAVGQEHVDSLISYWEHCADDHCTPGARLIGAYVREDEDDVPLDDAVLTWRAAA